MNKFARNLYQTAKHIASNTVISRLKIRDKIRFIVLRVREKHYTTLNEEQKRRELAAWYYRQTGETLNLDSPNDFNQKLQWLKVYDNLPEKTELSDKYCVRQWVENKIGSRYLIPIYGAWSRVEDIDFESLPLSFVLKANHGSGMNYVVKNKNQLNEKHVRNMLARWLRTPHDMSSMEQQYYAIPRKIIAEKYIEQSDGNLMDYKIHCFDGMPKFIQVIGDRDLNHHTAKECYFDLDWNRNQLMHNIYEQYEISPEKPKCLEEMINVARELSSGFKYVRVDLYIVDDGIKFGEMTFTPAAGIGKWGRYIPKEWW